MSELILNKIDERGVVTITLNRPELHNAFNDEFIKDMIGIFSEIETNPTCRLVVIESVGKSFCSGADLNWMKKMVNYTESENLEDSLKLYEMFEAINSCSLPVISKIQGAALGGGIGLVAVSDYCLSLESAKFGLTEVKLGLIPAVISPFVIDKIGQSASRAHFLSGSLFSAKRAYDIGLIHQVTDASKLDSELDKIVNNFLKAGPKAAVFCKKLIQYVHYNQNDKAELKKFTCDQISKLRVSEEGQEGMSALLDKNLPEWVK